MQHGYGGASIIVAVCLTACGDDAGPETATWETLVAGAWELPAGVEGYRCVRTTTTEDLLIAAIEPIAPIGTHHASLGIDDGYEGPDGTAACTPADLGDGVLFGTGVGTDRLELPAGTALRIAAGTRLVLNLHLFNASNAPLSGTSGLRIRRSEEEGATPLSVVLAGTDAFTIAPMDDTTVTGTCISERAGSLVGLMPHMHSLGEHMRVVLRRGDHEELLHDAPYDFEQQRYQLFDPIMPIVAGDRFEVSCSWNNPGAEPVEFGAGSRSEMCFAVLLRDAGPAPELACVE